MTSTGDSRDDRAERRAAVVEAEAAAARAVAAADALREAAKQVHLAPRTATLMAGSRGNLVATSANVRVASGDTPRAGHGDDDDDGVVLVDASVEGAGDGGAGNGGEDHQPSPPPPPPPPAVTAGASTTTASGGPSAGNTIGLAPPEPPAPPAPAAPATSSPAPLVVYRESKKEKKLRLPKFKGLDEPKLTVKAWLKAVKNELRRQAAILRTEWREHEVFIEMVASFEGEALLWFDTVEDSFTSREDQTFGNLSRLMKDRYMVKRSNPEVVARLRMRRQQRGEPLVEYAQKLREIASSNPVDEEWLVDAFLTGMSNVWSATMVRGQRPTTLNGAVNLALDVVGEYGEGYGVGLAAAIATQDSRAAAAPIAPGMAAAPAVGGMQFAGGGGLGSVVNGYDTLVVGPPPRYDTEGQLIAPRGSPAAGAVAQWNSVIPTGYRLVPVEMSSVQPGACAGKSSSMQSAGHAQTVAQLQRSDGGGKQGRRPGKALKMEAKAGNYQQQSRYGGGYAGGREPLLTKESRLQNLRRYVESKTPKSGGTRAKDGDVCYYCHKLGHYAYECELKRADFEDESPVVDQNAGSNSQDASGSGNERRA